jgi:excisionase family DNA binding protein
MDCMEFTASDEALLNVRETAQRLKVHENTIRNWARSGVLPSARVPGSRFHRFYARDVERLREDRGRAVSSREQELRTIGPELVDASQLAQWAGTRDAQARFPELVRRLLAATPGVTNISARAGEGVALSGWDGSADSGGTSFLPSGKLRLEFGVGANPKQKADEDYGKRLKASPNAADLTFVFLTPKRWRDGTSWAEDKANMREFANVRVLDADDIEGWLTETPAVHQWISEQLGRNPRDAQTLEQWWERFRSRTRPALPRELFLTGRESDITSLKEFLNGTPGTLSVQTGSRDEALAFVALTLADVDADNVSPAVIVRSAAVWDRMLAHPGRATLIALFEEPDLTGARDNGRHVISPLGRDDIVIGSALSLPRPDRLGAIRAFEAGDVAHDQAYHLAALARRSMPALVRKLARDQAFARPSWGEPANAAIFGPLILAGSWTDSEGDRELVASIADEAWPVIERTLLHAARTNDPPFVRSGNQWHLASSEEAFLVLGHTLTGSDLDQWRKLAVEAISETDPVLDLPADEQPMAGLHGIRRKNSSVLRRGIAEGVALVGSHHDERMSDNNTAAEHAEWIVGQILRRANADDSGRTWWALSDVLPLLAEAAPYVFLEAVHEDLAREHPLLETMFQDREQHSLFGISSPHSGLLWALETLCWSEDHILDAARALAQLRSIDPGGRLSNRPLESLCSVLVGWIRHTGASLELKKKVVDAICRESAETGWALVQGLWPNPMAAAMPPHAPRFRDWAPDGRSVLVTEWLDFIHFLTLHAVALTASDPARWADAVTRFGSLPPKDRALLTKTLADATEAKPFDAACRLKVWEQLREEIGKHRQFVDADWSMDDSTLKQLEAIADELEPSDTTERFTYLFGWHPSLPGVDARDFEAYQSELASLRREAVRATLDTTGLNGIKQLARRSAAPGHLGWVVGEVAPAELTDELLTWFCSEESNVQGVAVSWANFHIRGDGGADWLKSMLPKPQLASLDARVSLALSAPPAAIMWQTIEEADGALAEHYWSTAHPLGVALSDADRAIRSLLTHGRPWAAIDVVAGTLHNPEKDTSSLPAPELVREVLDAALKIDPRETPSQAPGYEVGVILDYLEARGTETPTLASYEFGYFQLLEHHRTPRALFAALSEEPALFVELVSRVYRSEHQPERKLNQDEVARAHHAWWVLRHWHTIPGRNDDGSVDGAHLTTWVRTARLQLADSGRTEIGDELIGQALASSPAGLDGAWPSEPVREILEATGSQSLESGIYTGVINNDGTTSRGVFDGGDLERDKAARYTEWSKQVAATSPRTGRLLRRIADSYERDARRHDDDATIRSDRE